MSFFKKLGSKIKGVAKKVGKGLGNAVNGVAKIAKASGIPIISQIGGVVDAVIPDKSVQKIAEKAAEQGVTKVEKIEETVQNLAPGATPSQVMQTTKAIATMVSNATGTPISNANAVTQVTFMDKVKEFFKKPISWILCGGVAVGAFLIFGKKGKKGGW